ncbi:MAG: hypothetical protein GX587_08400 [Bacteroidales bacterium]|nr:hypothetical protein [Bacteroidales bacterium]
MEKIKHGLQAKVLKKRQKPGYFTFFINELRPYGLLNRKKEIQNKAFCIELKNKEISDTIDHLCL